MKYSVQLYIGTDRVDFFDDETINVTSSIQNVRDIGKVFADYSQTFSVPASKTNNKIFKHYYNSDVVNAFDARFKADARIEINYIEFSKGKVKLDSVELRDGKAYSYNITFFSGIVSLKDILGEDQLDGLNWLSNFDTVFSYANIKSYLSSGRNLTVDSVFYNEAIIAPLISAEQRWYYDTSESIPGSGNLQASTTGLWGAYFRDFKYAIRLFLIVKAIEKKYTIANGYPANIVFSTDFFSTANPDFSSLYMWLHREKGRFDLGTSREVYLSTMNPESWEGVAMGTNNFSIFNIFSFSGVTSYGFTLNLDVSTTAANFNVYLERDGSVVESKLSNTGSLSYALVFSNLTQNGNYKIRIEHTIAFDVKSSSDIQMTANFSGGAPTSKTFTFTADQTLSIDENFIITENIPKMKVIDLLTGLFKMFNLTAYEENGTIIVNTLDNYYAAGSPFDITEYVDSSSMKVSPIPIYRDITFKYADTKSLLAQNHLEQFNQEWATESYAVEDKYDGGKYEVSIPFAHYKYERLYNLDTGAVTTIQYGWAVDRLNEDNTGQPYIGSPLLFYVSIPGSATTIRLRNDASFDSVSSYYIPSNSRGLVDDFTNINFKAELNEYTNTVFTKTLFKQYYENYISSVFDFQARIVEFKAYLPLNVLTKYKLNDIFIISGKSYRINSMSTNISTGESEMELINIV